MKKYTIKYTAVLFSLVMGGVLGGCDNAEYSTLETHAYIAEAESSMGTKITIAEKEITSTALTIRLSDKIDKESTFELVADQSALDKYNKVNGTNYVLLPAESYTLPCKIVIKAGEYVAAQTTINIKPFTEEMNKSGEQYALPLRLDSRDGVVPTMNQSGVYVIATGGIIKFSAPILGHMSTTTVDMTPGTITLNEYTVEMRFQIDRMGRNNQALFSATGIYIRLEDPAGVSNLIQIKGHGTYLNAITPFEANKWQHLAIVYNGSKFLIYVNGKLDAQKDVTPQPLTVTSMSLCSSGTYFASNCLVNEARLWDKALNESQIQNNATITSPRSKGLIAYWKMNEGSENVFKDMTGHGYDATCNQNVKWIHNILSTDVSSPWKNQ